MLNECGKLSSTLRQKCVKISSNQFPVRVESSISTSILLIFLDSSLFFVNLVSLSDRISKQSFHLTTSVSTIMLQIILRCLIFIQFPSVLNLPNYSAEIKGVSTALSDVIAKIFIEREIKFDVILIGEKSYAVNDAINQILKKNSNEFALKISRKSKVPLELTNLVVFAKNTQDLI